MKKNILIKVAQYLVVLLAIAALLLLIFNLKPPTTDFSVDKYPTLEQAIQALKAQDLPSYTVEKLNLLLDQTKKMSLSEEEKVKVKREIIRSAGFSNFDWKETLADLTCFQNVDIDIIEIKEPLLLYRRGYPGEPTSKFGLGKWWSDQSRTIEQARDELAILSNWGNPLSEEYHLIVPTGTRILAGIASPQEFKTPTGQVIETRLGGGMQYFINAPSNDWLEP